jgi:hypothetical protein
MDASGIFIERMNAVALRWSTAVACGALVAITRTTVWFHDRRGRSCPALAVAA